MIATILKNVLSFTNLVVGVPQGLPHQLNVNGVSVIPQLVAADGADYTISANATTVTVTRTAASPGASVRIYCEHWHTIEEVFPVAPHYVGTVPFIIASGDGGAGSFPVIEDEGAPVAGAPHGFINFVGAGVSAADAGSGVATVTIPGGIDGITIEDEGVAIPGNPHSTLNFVGAGVTATDVAGVATITVPGGGLAPDYAMFFGLTAPGDTDYPATIAARTGAGTGRVPFPQNGPSSGGMTIAIGGTLPATVAEINIPVIGTYEVTFKVHTTEPGQLQLELDGLALPETVSANMNPTLGGHPIVGNAFITTTVINSKLAVINPSGNSPALTITPADGSSTHSNAQSITIKRIA